MADSARGLEGKQDRRRHRHRRESRKELVIMHYEGQKSQDVIDTGRSQLTGSLLLANTGVGHSG